MTKQTSSVRLGIVCCIPAVRDGHGRLMCHPSIGRLLDMLRERLPGAKLCIPVLSETNADSKHVLSFPQKDVTELPPLKSVIRSQVHYFQTRTILRRFARSVDRLFIRVPFQLPRALLGLQTPKLLHVVGNPQQIVSCSSDYRGLMRRLALRFAEHSNATMRRLVAEPMTRVATNGEELWSLLQCRDGRVVVSSCLYQDEMRPRKNLSLGQPPKLLFVGFLRPEKGIGNLLDAFESLRKTRPLKLTLVGGSDRASDAEASARERIRNSPFRDDIAATGVVDFGESLFDLYRTHDVFVLPSLSEGTPRTLVEARAFGCPVVATRVGGIPSSVEHEKTGLLVEPRDSPGLAAAIDRILTDESLRLHLIEQGRQGLSQFTLEHFVDELVEEIMMLPGSAGSLGAQLSASAD